jgi:hypothetical protein
VPRTGVEDVEEPEEPLVEPTQQNRNLFLNMVEEEQNKWGKIPAT